MGGFEPGENLLRCLLLQRAVNFNRRAGPFVRALNPVLTDLYISMGEYLKLLYLEPAGTAE